MLGFGCAARRIRVDGAALYPASDPVVLANVLLLSVDGQLTGLYVPLTVDLPSQLEGLFDWSDRFNVTLAGLPVAEGTSAKWSC